MPRKATGTLIYTQGKGWCARIPMIVGYVDGKPVREKQWFELGTESRAVAKRKVAKIIADNASGKIPSPDDARRAETVSEACERVHEDRKADGVKDATNEIARLRRFAVKEIGQLDVTRVTPKHVNAVLDAVKAAGLSRQTAQHVKQDMGNVFAALRREGTIAIDPVRDAELPKFPQTVKKERAVLTDDELVAYLGYEHPQEHWRLAILERQVMACVARMFGGLRTGDLHALMWEAFDVGDDGAFTWGYAPRQKTKRPQRLEVPAMLRPILRDWWERHGRPTTGLLFPSRRGERAGEVKLKVSHADAFRRDLKRAFGLEIWKWDPPSKTGEQKMGKYEPAPDRYMTARERVLFTETAETLPVDFHSWRRAYSQALADADVNAQQASRLAGHASLSAHQRYLANASKLAILPEAALPKLTVSIGHDDRTRRAREDEIVVPAYQAARALAATYNPAQEWMRTVTPEAAGSSPVRPAEIFESYEP